MRRPLGACALGCAAVLLAGAAPPPTGEVTVTVSGLRNSDGVVRACMTANPQRFPKCRGDAGAYAKVVKAGKRIELRFTGVVPGRYAIALLHDENDNGKADRALGMMPKEGFGFSRDAPVRMGPPSFASAAFDIADTPRKLAITMRYMM